MLTKIDRWLTRVRFFRPQPAFEGWVQQRVMPIVGPALLFLALAFGLGMLAGVAWLGFQWTVDTFCTWPAVAFLDLCGLNSAIAKV